MLVSSDTKKVAIAVSDNTLVARVNRGGFVVFINSPEQTCQD